MVIVKYQRGCIGTWKGDRVKGDLERLSISYYCVIGMYGVCTATTMQYAAAMAGWPVGWRLGTKNGGLHVCVCVCVCM